jgi:DNA-directed RNA polymerase subunit K/omega
MSLEPLSIREVENQSKDIYESVVVMSKRAKQVLGDRIVEEIIESTDEDEMGVYDEVIENNPDDYEELEKPTTVSVNEFLDGTLEWKKDQEDS